MSFVIRNIDTLTFQTTEGRFSSELDLARHYPTAKAANAERYDGERIINLRTGRDVTSTPSEEHE
ncbi:hypothetical protein CCR94_18235 [Rhodoblastus sphagnicola]|uniref:Uncharacterized protein n=1 Tax=Rhodoblastus sphagnicola TaxID=333368 RepID=A0A2S6N0X1_9HYPH|nr:hypothetical protein [Rhodoblastus sphagnicola]MBB4200594.1 hypothetical protein [Rhodoblastus sphagnicola]PPQ28238.1 hypothetical protein CCR94_18235 [Rhodoblastus sphagnicola]